MRRVTIVLSLLAILAACGCAEPADNKVTLIDALSARTSSNPRHNDCAKLLATYCQRHDKDYALWAMDYVSLCLMGGNYDAAKAELMNCQKDIASRQDKNRETAAAIANESQKLFKGEPYERAMLCCYLGLLHYMDEDYNNARIFFAKADQEDATCGDDMKDFRHDFQLAHYWLGRSYLKLDQSDNARVAFAKASQSLLRKGQEKETAAIRKQHDKDRNTRIRLEKQSYKNAIEAKPPVAGAADVSDSPAWGEMPAALPYAAATNPVELTTGKPEEFFSVGYQQQVNLILFIETGTGPIRLVDDYGDYIFRSPYIERNALVYIDGHRAGPAFQVLDVFHQADTRGKSEKDAAQAAKGLTKAVLKQMPFGVGTAAAYWDVRADERYWSLLPGEVHVFAAKVRPGLHTVSIRCADANGYLLPRYNLTRYHLPVLEDRESVFILSTRPEADNVYVPAKN